MSDLSIKEVESRISRNLEPSLKTAFEQAGYSWPDRCRLRVSLVDASGRKKRSNAKADNWSPDSGWLQARFEPDDAATADTAKPAGLSRSITEPPADNAEPASPKHDPSAPNVEPGLVAVLKALARAENTPGWNFVSLKKFSNEILPAECSELSPIDQRHFLGRAINERLITTSKVANPKDPRFPVTTIRLDRLHDVVQRILGGQTRRGPAFAPIHIEGEPLSATILRERR